MNWKSFLLVTVLFAGALLAGRFMRLDSGSGEITQRPPLWCQPALGACHYPVEGGGEIRFTLSPRENIQPMVPLKAVVEISGVYGEANAMTLTGLNMEMGYNRFRFRPTGSGYEADVIIPVCTLDKMEWQAMLEIVIDGEQTAIPFNFIVERK